MALHKSLRRPHSFLPDLTNLNHRREPLCTCGLPKINRAHKDDDALDGRYEQQTDDEGNSDA
jgi:hypothetical protein